MRCPQCGLESREGIRFCEECGGRLEHTCPACGAEVPLTGKFCGVCGQPLTSRASPSASALSPQRYTPRRLAERFLSSRPELLSERKQVTVLFADLRGSLELLAHRDPEEARTLLDPILGRMMDAVHRYEGMVNQVLGDGIMALFGAPVAQEDHAVRACHAALDMQEAVKRHQEALYPGLRRELAIRIGLNSGEVVVRSISSDLQMDYSAVGQTTHLAGRMEQLARPGSTLITAATHRLAAGYVEVKSLGPVAVKGLTEPLEIFELIGASPARTRMQVSRARWLSQFVGRETELAELARAAEHADKGRGQVVALVGEPGVGKSRLAFEFERAHLPLGWLILETGAVSYGRSTAYLPISNLLRSYFRLDEDDSPQRIHDKVGAQLLTLDATLASALPAVLALLGPIEDPDWLRLDPAQRRQQTLEALVRLLMRHCRHQGVCLLVEDLHWIDSETQAFLDRLVESVPEARMLVLATYRPEYEHRWRQKTCYTEQAVGPLSRAMAERLLDELLGDAPELVPVKRELIERTEGNPFFLEESVWNLVETEVLIGQRGAYRLARPPASFRVPATVQTVLAARIDRLSPKEKHLLQCAAVIGKDVPLGLLQAIGDLGEDELRRRIGSLVTGEFLLESTLFPVPEYSFKHALTLEVAYGSLLGERRHALHARIVEALERLYPDRRTDQVEVLARHAVGGEMWEKAVRYCKEAGAKAFNRSAHRAAVEHFERALDALSHLPDTRVRAEQAIDLRLDLRYALMPLGEFGRVLGYLREAEAMALAAEDQHRLALVWSFLTNYFQLMGDLDQAVEHGQRALALASGLGDSLPQIVANTYLASTYYTLGDYGRAVEVATRNVVALTGALAYERFGLAPLPSVYSRTWMASSFAELGEFSRAFTTAAEGLEIAETAQYSFSLIYAHYGAGVVALRKGEADRAIAALARAIGLCREADIRLLFSTVAMPLISAYSLAGRGEDAFGLLDEAGRQAASISDPVERRWRTGALAEALLFSGRIREALPHARSYLAQRRTLGTRGYEAWALRLLGEAAARQAEPEVEESLACFREALEIAEERSMRPLIAHCHLGLGRLYGRLGQPETARAELCAAHELFRSMEMTRWLDEMSRDVGSGECTDPLD